MMSEIVNERITTSSSCSIPPSIFNDRGELIYKREGGGTRSTPSAYHPQSTTLMIEGGACSDRWYILWHTIHSVRLSTDEYAR